MSFGRCQNFKQAFYLSANEVRFAGDPASCTRAWRAKGDSTQNPETYQFTTGYFSGDMTLSIRYDFQPVPEPNLMTLTFLALISMPLMRK